MSIDDIDGKIYASIGGAQTSRRHRVWSEAKQKLDEMGIEYKEIVGGFIITDTGSDRRFYYYTSKNRWRKEGDNKYYRCKNVSDLLDRFILKEQK